MSQMLLDTASVLYTVCAIPSAWEAYRTKKCAINGWHLVIWSAAQILMLFYTALPLQPVAFAGYALGAVCLFILINAKLAGKNEQSVKKPRIVPATHAESRVRHTTTPSKTVFRADTYYQTKGGCKAYVMGSLNETSLWGLIYYKGMWCATEWDLNGQFNQTDTHADQQFDLIPPQLH